MQRPLPSQEYLNECLAYDVITGDLTWRARPAAHFSSERMWKAWNKQFAGKPALASRSGTGYLHGALDQKTAKSHRVIWKMMTGDDADQIDHIDGDKMNNAWSNLRNVGYPENSRNLCRASNNTSGHTGVTWHARLQKWRASIKSGGLTRHIGVYGRIEDAVAARRAEERKLGFHPNHGRATA